MSKHLHSIGSWQQVLIGTCLSGFMVAVPADSLVLRADRIFDGQELQSNKAVWIVDDQIREVGDFEQLKWQAEQVLDLGDASLLPGLIELHSHIRFQNIPEAVILEHGITTARDLGGPLKSHTLDSGHLRLLSAGPILTVPGGYPLNVFAHGHHGHSHEQGNEIGVGLSSVAEAEAAVSHLIANGASIIKVALEPGGENGAPWNQHSQHGHAQWPMLSSELLKTITLTAHQAGKRVSAHLSENQGVKLALEAGVDEWAHMPCLKIDDNLLKQAVQKGVTVISTLDTLSHCPGIYQNAERFAQWGGSIMYGAELAHNDIPWGFDSQEMQLLMQLTGMNSVQALSVATAKAGEYLGLAPLGRLKSNAPADLIAVKGNALDKLKTLEYPDLVIVAGKIIKNNFPKPTTVVNPNN